MIKLKSQAAIVCAAIAAGFVIGAPTAEAAPIITDAPGPDVGNAQGPAPIRFFGAGGSRVQQVYSSAFFTGGPETITAIQFRPFPGAAPSGFFGNTVSISDLDIALSTTSLLDESSTPLGTTFNANTGADVATVYSGALTLTTSDTGNPPGPQAFDYTINLQSPFLYNPALGNLLLDVKIPTSATVSGIGFGFLTFDTVNTFDDGIFSIVDISNGNAVTGQASTAGAITQFIGTPASGSSVPEPSTVLLLGGGLLGLGWIRRRPQS